MQKRLFILYSLIFLLSSIMFFSQGQNISQNLKAEELNNLIDKAPETVFRKANLLLKEAREKNIPELELSMLQIKCSCYEKKYDFKNLILCSQELLEKAEAYQSSSYSILAEVFLFKAYSFNNLNKFAYQHLEKGLELSNATGSKDSLTIDATSKLYVSFANYYLLKNDNKKRLLYMIKAMEEHQKYPDKNYLDRRKYVDYANIASVYNDINVDSTEHYALLSLKYENFSKLKNAEFSNFLVLGNVNLIKKDFSKAIYYLKKAENIEKYINHINREILYNYFIETYKKDGKSDSAKIYENKKDLLNLNIYKNRNDSLSRILEENNEKDQQRSIVLLGIISIVLLTLIVIFYLKIRKAKVIIQKPVANTSPEDYNKLLDMAKKDDTAFISAFRNMYPEFLEKLQEICPDLSISELELCALIKLNLSTKEIAASKNLSYRTIQNKKYIIRKKFNIAPESDIYKWMSKI